MVEYTHAEQVRVAEEVARLPEGMLIIGWLADYAVMREQVRECQYQRVKVSAIPGIAISGV